MIVGTGSELSMQNLAQHIILLRILQFSVVSQTYRCVLLATLWNSSLNYVRLLLKVNQHISELVKGEPDLLGEHKNLGIGKANLLRSGKKILLLGIGPILSGFAG